MAINSAGTDAVICPGEILQEELEARGMTQKELAQKMGRGRGPIRKQISFTYGPV